MSESTTLDDLIEALAGAVVAAQERVQAHHIANLRKYFESDKDDARVFRPINLTLRIPSLDPDRQKASAKEGKIAEDEIMVPYFAIAPGNQLRIKEVEISFDANIDQVASGDNSKSAGVSAASQEGTKGSEATAGEAASEKFFKPILQRKTVGVDIRSGFLPKTSKTAHVVLKVEGGEPPEGVLRVIHHLTKLI